jgi:GT2 family glycosyltransferase
MSTQIDLEIIILSYNSQFWLKKTLQTLKTHHLAKTKYEVSVTVVDNNSQDESVQMLQKEFKWVKTVQLAENGGFAAGNNIALKASRARYCMLLNSDIECTPQSNFDVLISFMDDHEQIGVITPKVIFTNGRLDPACHRGEPTLFASFAYYAGLEKLFPYSKTFGAYHQSYKRLDTIHTIDACSGAAMIVRMEAVKDIGLLDERFFMYAEDLDWCKRFRDAGFLITYHPSVVVIHHKYKSGIKGSSKQIARKTRHHFYDTMLQYYDKHYAQQYPSFVRSLVKYFTIIKKGAL